MKTDTITTIDRYKVSPAYGKNVLPFVSLLDKPRMGYNPQMHMTGAVPHGQVVEVLDKKQEHNATWCKIQCDIEQDGETYHQEGWCSAKFLEDAGKAYFESVNR